MYTMNDAKVNEFLDSITKPSTKASYKTSMKFYLEFVNETNKNPTKDENGNVVKIDGQKLLDIKKDDTDKQVEKSMSASHSDWDALSTSSPQARIRMECE